MHTPPLLPPCSPPARASHYTAASGPCSGLVPACPVSLLFFFSKGRRGDHLLGPLILVKFHICSRDLAVTSEPRPPVSNAKWHLNQELTATGYSVSPLEQSDSSRSLLQEAQGAQPFDSYWNCDFVSLFPISQFILPSQFNMNIPQNWNDKPRHH